MIIPTNASPPPPPPTKKYPPFPRQLLSGILLWILSLALPCMVFGIYSSKNNLDEYTTMWGFYAFPLGCCCGWYAIQFAAYANILLIASWLLAWFRHPRIAAFLALLALLLSADALLLFGKPFDADEGGVRHMLLDHFHIGFYIWLASICATLATALLLSVRIRPTQ